MKIMTPIGPFWLQADDTGLTRGTFTPLPEDSAEKTNPHLVQAKKELVEYFAGQRQNFTVPLSIKVGTAFQRQVWQALQEIPFGDTRSYQAIAQAIDNPKAVRAIGQANRHNPIAIIIPCHRVIGKNGQLTGYMGTSGVELKRQLLALEGVNF
ncbi:methylated-DNA--[protein]-cysteine S-methyltransferase [Enterococcus sp. LJL120]